MKSKKSLLLWFAVLLWAGSANPVEGTEPVFRVAFYEEAPYQFMDEKGQAVGLLIDIFDQVAERSGYSAEYTCYATLNACVNALEDGTVDLVLGMPSSSGYQLPETAELYASNLVIAEAMGRAGSGKESSGYRVGYNYQTTGNTIIYSLVADRYIISDRVSTLMEHLANGQVDAAILDKAVLDYVQEESYPDLSGRSRCFGRSQISSMKSMGRTPCR